MFKELAVVEFSTKLTDFKYLRQMFNESSVSDRMIIQTIKNVRLKDETHQLDDISLLSNLIKYFIVLYIYVYTYTYIYLFLYLFIVIMKRNYQ